MPMSYLNFTISGASNAEAYWEANAYLLANYPSLINAGNFGYVITGGSYPVTASSLAAFYIGYFIGPNKPLSELAGAITPMLEYINTTWPSQLGIVYDTSTYPDFYSWYLAAFPESDFGVGTGGLVASRFLDANALFAPHETLVQTLKESILTPGYVSINMMAGPGLWNAVPNGGSDSIHPGWGKVYVEFSRYPPLLLDLLPHFHRSSLVFDILHFVFATILTRVKWQADLGFKNSHKWQLGASECDFESRSYKRLDKQVYASSCRTRRATRGMLY